VRNRSRWLIESGILDLAAAILMICWIHVGQTTGRGRMDHEHKSHGQSIKDIYLYPLIRDARQYLRGDFTR
jgi:hypothetical protein